LPPAAHDRDDAGAVGVCRTVDVESQREAILVPVHHIRGDQRPARLGRTRRARGRCCARACEKSGKYDERTQAGAHSDAHHATAA
jgi:hypothetical protein